MPLLEMTGVHKRFGGVQAVADAGLSADAGEVHALLGPNGSGKSTLLKVLTGVVAPDSGVITIGGKPTRIGDPRDALRAGVAAVYQELSLVPELSVAENVMLGVEPATRLGFLDRKGGLRRAEAVLDRFGDAFGGAAPLLTPVGELDPGQQQIVEICKALAREPKILVLDEATASLRASQVDALIDVIRNLVDTGVLVIFTSHRLAEIKRICDRATVMRGGRSIATLPLDGESRERELLRLMAGELAEIDRPPSSAGDAVRLRVTDLTASGVHGVSFEAREGEILGIGGLAGQGQSDVLAALFGATRRTAGVVELDERPVLATSPARAIAAGFAYVPGDRGREGLALRRPMLENLALPSLRGRFALRKARESRAGRDLADRVNAVYGSLDDNVTTLSGGNQQKVVVAKWLPTEPRVVLMDDPMKGIDVRAKAELFTLIRQLAADGATVVLSSSDDAELVELCDRVLTMFEGRVVDELSGARLTDDELLASALGVER